MSAKSNTPLPPAKGFAGGRRIDFPAGAPPPPNFQYDHILVLFGYLGLLCCGVREVLCSAGGALRRWVVVVVGVGLLLLGRCCCWVVLDVAVVVVAVVVVGLLFVLGCCYCRVAVVGLL